MPDYSQRCDAQRRRLAFIAKPYRLASRDLNGGVRPSGDYTQELFNRMGTEGNTARQRAMALVGGRSSAPIPPGKMAAQWVIESRQAEMFIGYASYAKKRRHTEGVTVLAIPEPFNPRAQYALAILTPKAQRLAEFLQSQKAKAIRLEAGFGV